MRIILVTAAAATTTTGVRALLLRGSRCWSSSPTRTRRRVVCRSASTSDVSRQGTHSLKWTKFQEGVLPMWVADMDLACPGPVREAVEKRALHGIYGYTSASDGLKRAIADNVNEAWGVQDARESWIRFHPGLIAGLYHTSRLVKDGVVIAPQPVYPPFLNAARDSASEFVAVDSGDFDALESALEASRDKPTALLWCNPHNPTGRVWRREELERLAGLVEKYRDSIVAVCSDEVWSGLVLDERVTPFTSLGEIESEALRKRLVVLTSPSKTYNVASLDFAIAIVPDDSLRRKYFRAGRDQAEVTPFGFAAAEAIFLGGGECHDIIRPAGGACEEWRKQVVKHLAANRDFAVNFVQENCAPHIKVASVPEASYLLWLQVSRDLFENSEVPYSAADFLREKVGIGLTDGRPFFSGTDTKEASTYVRLNFGCSRDRLEQGLMKLAEATR